MSISPEVYNEAIKGLAPVRVSLIACQFSSKGPQRGELRVEAMRGVPARDTTRDHAGDLLFAISQEVEFSIWGHEDVKRAEGSCTFLLQVRMSEPPPEGFWDVFLYRNMPLYINPAVRDLTSALSARANLPAELLASIPLVAALPSVEAQVAVAPFVSTEPAPKKSRSRAAKSST